MNTTQQLTEFFFNIYFFLGLLLKLMPETHFRKVGTGSCLHLSCITSSVCVWELKRLVTVLVLQVRCFPILVQHNFLAAQQCNALFLVLLVLV